jgi:hypothetical protein
MLAVAGRVTASALGRNESSPICDVVIGRLLDSFSDARSVVAAHDPPRREHRSTNARGDKQSHPAQHSRT